MSLLALVLPSLGLPSRTVIQSACGIVGKNLEVTAKATEQELAGWLAEWWRPLQSKDQIIAK